MYCPSCSKMVSYDAAVIEADDLEPNVQDVTVSDVDGQKQTQVKGSVTGSVRMAMPCAECGEELKEANFDIDAEFVLEIEGEIPEEGLEAMLEVEHEDPEERESGGGRFKKNMRGFDMEVTVRYEDGDVKAEEKFSVGDEIAAGDFETIS